MRRNRVVQAGLAAVAILGLGWSLAPRADDAAVTAPQTAGEVATAIFAGGCFWCVEADFEKVPGVLEAVSGYTGGTVANPTYRQVGAGGTGHVEAVEVRYDPAKVSYEQLLDVFWRNVDFLDDGGQFCDRGEEYTTAIFTQGAAQHEAAAASKTALAAAHQFPGPIKTPITVAGTFYPAEEYHQDYYKKNPLQYRIYRWNCGRDQRLAEIWRPAS